jgi:4-amino-4-deoxy-L-arabinose transferase-like glycosyltransferase
MNSSKRTALTVLGILLLVRLVAMAWIPLNDTTEARYAEIARKMLETGNWVTLWHDYGIPFWAKPPLSTWASALSMMLFGVNELAARLPSLLLSLLTLWLTLTLSWRRQDDDSAMIVALVLAGGLLFFATAGTVMTDSALMLSVALIQVAFWHALTRPGRLWGYLFFVGIGIGMLAKGPVAVVLTAMPIGLWVIARGAWRPIWQRLPWISGTLLAIIIAAPWYALAEMRTPGFLHYFIMGEHFGRFLDSGWKGDRYGFAHATPRGMIWAYTFAALLPWSLPACAWLLRHLRARGRGRDDDGWLLYLGLWSVMTLLFFTLSGNIIWPYSMPMLPGFALLFAELRRRHAPGAGYRGLAFGGLFSAAIGVIAIVGFAAFPGKIGRTQKPLIEAWRAQAPTPQSQLLFWDSRREFSAEFYSGGRAKTTTDPARAQALLQDGQTDFIAVPQDKYASLPAAVRTAFGELGRFNNPGETFLLLRKTHP